MIRGVLLGLVTLAGACTWSEPAAGPGPDKLKVVALPFLSSVAFHIAAEEGFFTEQHLEVEFVRLSRNVEAIPALARGEVDAGIGQLTVNILNAIAGGARIRFVAGSSYLSTDGCTYTAIVARRDLVESNRLADVRQLPGLRFELDPILPQAYYVHRLLTPAGYTLDDLDLVNLPVPANLDALTTGAIDLTVLSEPYLSRALGMGKAVIWKRSEELVPDFQVASVMFGPSLLDDRPEVGERFIVAVLKALRRFREGKTPRNLEIVERATGLGRDVVEAVCWPAVREDARVVGAGLAEYQEWLVSRKLIDRVLSDDELIDHRFVEHANRVLQE